MRRVSIFLFVIAITTFSLCYTVLEIEAYHPDNASSLIDKAIALKKLGRSDEFILDVIADEMQHDLESGNFKFDNVIFFVRGNKTVVTDNEFRRLSEAGFSEDAQRQLVGIPQWLTLGVSAVWLFKTADFVPAPILRIFLTPRSYYEPRMPLLLHPSKIKINIWHWIYGQARKVDLNFGVTATNSKTETGQDEKTNYVLTGLSYELNKSALINIGAASAVKDVTHKKNQWYIGITLDSNLLKALGIK